MQLKLQLGHQELIGRTGNPAITGFQLPKVVWLQMEEPQAYVRLRQILLPKDYLGYVLTGELVTPSVRCRMFKPGASAMGRGHTQYHQDQSSSIPLGS